eukprot:INCI886.1.p1 GENE.INCI886.1~~INCI886.1.p1  ORF type:complete len:372 (-),score=36.06 INCI886.1:329-1444(-)
MRAVSRVGLGFTRSPLRACCSLTSPRRIATTTVRMARNNPTRILFAAKADQWDVYSELLPNALSEASVDAELIRLKDEAADAAGGFEAVDPESVDWIVYAPNSRLQDFTPYKRLKGVLSLWAGVEKVEGNRTFSAPLARMVDPSGLTPGMVEWVTGHVLRHHLGMDAHIARNGGGASISGPRWKQTAPPLARDRPVTILGMGELGSACAEALAFLGFPVTGWARRHREIAGVEVLTGEVEEALARGHIVVLLLPHSRSTERLIDAKRLAAMPQGSVLLNPGRGPLVVEDDLISALDSGHLAHATLDTFVTEPLPDDHPFWTHPQVTVTPHIASVTRPESAARVLAENIRRGQAGEPLLNVVDRAEALTKSP